MRNDFEPKNLIKINSLSFKLVPLIPVFSSSGPLFKIKNNIQLSWKEIPNKCRGNSGCFGIGKSKNAWRSNIICGIASLFQVQVGDKNKINLSPLTFVFLFSSTNFLIPPRRIKKYFLCHILYVISFCFIIYSTMNIIVCSSIEMQT